MRIVLLILIALVLVWYLFVVFWPGNPEAWHIDPNEADEPGIMGAQAVGSAAPVFDADAGKVLQVFDDIVRAEGAVLFAGSVEDGFVTYETRTRFLRIRDYVTLKASPVEGGTAVAYRAVTSTGGYDYGMNTKRMARWIEAVRDAL